MTLQLGFAPSNLVRVAARDGATGEPAAAMLYPLTRPSGARRRGGAGTDWAPFPTPDWLTCPRLKARISRLEDDRWVEKLEARLAAAPPAVRAAMEEAHAACELRCVPRVPPDFFFVSDSCCIANETYPTS